MNGKKVKNEPKNILCPKCKHKMLLLQTPKFTYKNGQNRVFYGCSAFPRCRAILGARGQHHVRRQRGRRRWQVRGDPFRCRQQLRGVLLRVGVLPRREQFQVFRQQVNGAGGEAVPQRRAQQQPPALPAMTDAMGNPRAKGHPRRREAGRQHEGVGVATPL